MSFFKRLFGKTKTEIQPITLVIQGEVVNMKSDVDSTEKPKDYDISEIKKQSTQVKNRDGFLASINYIKDFISGKDIELREMISLLKKAIPYMKKEPTIADSEIINYVEIQIGRFLAQDNPDYQIDIADLYSRINSEHAIKYLENKLGEFESDKKKSIEHFDCLIKLSDYYLESKQGDKAFQTVRRAGLLVTNFKDKTDYLWKHRILAQKSALICLHGQKNPNYSDYIHYEIVAFILDIACDANGFPHLSNFFHRKNICFNEGWGFQDNEFFDQALLSLNIFNYRQELIKDIYEFSFNELPLKMGIPKEYLKEDLLKPLINLSEDFDSNYPEWRKIMILQEDYNKILFDISLPHSFSGEVVKKYYDREIK